MGNKVLKYFIAFILSLSSLHMISVKAEGTTYKIYPTPQDISYQDKSLNLTPSVNVVYAKGIDQYTKAKAQEVLKSLGKNVEISDSLSKDKTNLLVGVFNEEDQIKAYFKEQNLINDVSFFSKNDAHIVSIKDNIISIIGKDTDASFRGLTSLKHIFSQVRNNQIRNLVIKDYADIKGRGFIEGYYGNPWSNSDRSELMRFGGDYKLNQYIYAPKNDPKHNEKWRELYTESELSEIRKLAEAGNKSKCYYVYALHPFMNKAITFHGQYQHDLGIIKAKFEQLMKNGVKQFAILADDASVPENNPNHYVTLMKDLTQWLKEKAKVYEGLKTDTIFCPNDYMHDGSSYEIRTLKNLPESVSIIQTGGQVWGHVGRDFNDKFFKNSGRPAYMWINWPCSDQTRDSLIMGGAEKVLYPDVDPKTVSGIVINPMQQSEPSKQGIFTNADYAWNIWKNSAKYTKVWNDSFTYIDHGNMYETEASKAYRALSKHMLSSRYLYNDESFDIKDKLKSFISDLSKGKSVKKQAEELVREFTILKNASKTLRSRGNQRTVKQIVYWLDCWDNTSESIISYLNTAIALEDKLSNKEIWKRFTKGRQEYENSKKHKFLYINYYEYAQVGRLHITPFMKRLDALLSAEVSHIVNPGIQTQRFITNRSDDPKGEIKNIFDNKPDTEVTYVSPNKIEKGTYAGVLYSKPIDINSALFRLGRNQNPNDTFSKVKVQYSINGHDWKDLDKEYDNPKDLMLENLNLKSVRGLRVIATQEKSNTWLGIRDIVINPKDKEPQEKTTVTLDKVGVRIYDINSIIDGDDNSYAHLAEYPYKTGPIQDYIPKDASVTLHFSKPKLLTQIHFKQDSGTDKVTKYVFEYTENGKDWKELASYNGDSVVNLDVTDKKITVQALRVRNMELNLQEHDKSKGYWWKLYEFNAGTNSKPKLNPDVEYTSRWSIYQGSKSYLLDNNPSTAFDFNTNPSAKKGDYIGLNFKKIIKVGKVHIVVGGNRNKGDKFVKYTLEYSKDGHTWHTYKSYTGQTNEKDTIDENLEGIEAQYLRIVNQQDKNSWIIFSDFIVDEFDEDAEYTSQNIISNTKTNAKAYVRLDKANVKAKDRIVLGKDQYVGVDLNRIKDLKEVSIKTDSNDLTVELSKNNYDWEKLDPKKIAEARYVRIINKTNKNINFKLNSWVVKSREVESPKLHSTTMGINSSWGVSEDSRYNNAAFDGNVDTYTEFADLPQKGQEIIYDLGQTRTIKTLRLYCQDNAVNYIRDAEILVSDDLKNWKKVVSIGDAKENLNDANITCINSGLYKTSQRYPNKVYAEGKIDPTKARYVKILMTASNNNRAVTFNEIVINDGEYVPVSNDPTFKASTIEEQGHAPQNMVDGDLSTYYKAGSNKAGEITYILSQDLEVKRFNIVQHGTITHAQVKALVELNGKRIWVDLGKLDHSLNEIYVPYARVFKLKIVWKDKAVPMISEIISLTDKEYGYSKEDLKKYVDSLKPDEKLYTKASYKAFAEAKEKALKAITEDKDISVVYGQLKHAYLDLVKKANTSELEKEIDSIKQLNPEDYTKDSWNHLNNLLNKANKLLQKELTADQEKDIKAMIRQLKEAQRALVKKGKIYKMLNSPDEVERGKTAVFRSEALLKDFDKLIIDNQIIDKKNYTVTSGSTVVTLKASYTKTLKTGMHQLIIVSKDGYATVKFKAVDKVITTETKPEKDIGKTKKKQNKKTDTGDRTNILIYMVLIIISVCAAYLIRRKLS